MVHLLVGRFSHPPESQHPELDPVHPNSAMCLYLCLSVSKSIYYMYIYRCVCVPAYAWPQSLHQALAL